MNLIRTIVTILCLCPALPALTQTPNLADGKPRPFSREIQLTDVLGHRWVDELVTYNLDFPAKQPTLNSIRLYDVDNQKELPFQLSEIVFHGEQQQFVKSAEIAFFVDELPANGARTYAVLWDPGSFATASQPAAALKETDMQAETFEVTNGLFGVRLAGRKRFDPPIDATTVPGPLRGFKGPDGVWRATSRFVTDARLLGWKSELLEQGPLWKLYRVRFEFDGDRFYELDLKMVVDHPYAYVTERNNFRPRLAELPHPLCGSSGHMAHGQSYTRWGPADQLRIPVARAVRHWLLAVGDKRQWTEQRYPGGHQTAYPYLGYIRTKVCDLPLDKVKDWHLDWQQKLPGDYWQYAWNKDRTSYLPNFGSDLYLAVGMMALVLPEHPNSKQWLQYCLGELDKELTYYISPDGVGEENIANYYLWTWRQLTVLFGALKHNGIFDAARHPRYQAACRFWIEILTPPQPKLAAYASSEPIQPDQRRRRIPPFGDHGFNNNECLELGGQTGLLKDANPQLAGESAWAWREGPLPGAHGDLHQAARTRPVPGPVHLGLRAEVRAS